MMNYFRIWIVESNSLFEWFVSQTAPQEPNFNFDNQMLAYQMVFLKSHGGLNECFTIQMPITMIPGIWIQNKQVFYYTQFN